MFVGALHEGKTVRTPLLDHGFIGNDLEPALVAARYVALPNVSATKADCNGRLRRGNIVSRPLFGAWLGIGLGEQIRFAPPGYPMSMSTNTVGIDMILEG
jgi:hypothetical protein